jgi:hypothetical protein
VHVCLIRDAAARPCAAALLIAGRLDPHGAAGQHCSAQRSNTGTACVQGRPESVLQKEPPWVAWLGDWEGNWEKEAIAARMYFSKRVPHSSATPVSRVPSLPQTLEFYHINHRRGRSAPSLCSPSPA